MSSPSRCQSGNSPLEVERLPVRFSHDETRVITRPFFPGGETRIRGVIDRVKRLSEERVESVLAHVLRNFERRHEDIRSVFREHYEAAVNQAGTPEGISESRRLLIGAYFTME